MDVASVQVPAAVAAALAGVAAGADRSAARRLSDRYRSGASSQHGPVVRSDAELAAYAVARFPATYAAAVAALTAAARAVPDLAPTRLLDVGSGLGATACAALAVWPDLAEVTCVEPDPRAVAAGRTVLAAAARATTRTTWVTADLAAVAGRRADVVTAGYVGNELTDPVAAAGTLWEATGDLLVLLEPGRRPAYTALLQARDHLLALGATTAAPCPHDDRCPLPRSDWCHFGQRLPRTAEHRRLKEADLPYEDEKYSYVALARGPVPARSARVIRRPARRKGLVELTVCAPGGVVADRIGRSDARYRAAKDARWGDAWTPAPGRAPRRAIGHAPGRGDAPPPG